MMKRKTARAIVTIALVLGVVIIAVRIHPSPAGDPPAHKMPPAHFTLRLDGNSWLCASSGTIVSCTYRGPPNRR